jgi:hypothetical protein
MAAQAQTPTHIEDLGWLVGTWKRMYNKSGHTGHERWFIDPEIGLRGYGVTMKGRDTVFVEKLRIVNGDDGLYYVADVIENPKPTYFKITSVTQNEFTCENASHDFPKNIHYRRKVKDLVATVSGNGRSITYKFIKTD